MDSGMQVGRKEGAPRKVTSVGKKGCKGKLGEKSEGERAEMQLWSKKSCQVTERDGGKIRTAFRVKKNLTNPRKRTGGKASRVTERKKKKRYSAYYPRERETEKGTIKSRELSGEIWNRTRPTQR